MKISTAGATIGALAALGLVVATGFSDGQAHPAAPGTVAVSVQPTNAETSTGSIPPPPSAPKSGQGRGSHSTSLVAPAPAEATTVTLPSPAAAVAVKPPPVLSPADYRQPASPIPAAGDADALARCSAEALAIRLDPGFRPEVQQQFIDHALRQCLTYYQR